MQLVLDRSVAFRGLTLECLERTGLAFDVDDVLYGVGADGADQLVLEVIDADEEAQSLHVGPGGYSPDAGPREPASEKPLLGKVAQAG